MAIGTNRQPVDLISARNRSRNRSAQQEDFEPADYWVNGGTLEENEETGELDFVSVFGIPNTRIKVPTGGGAIAQIAGVRRQELDEIALGLEPGETTYLTYGTDDTVQTVGGFVIQVRRVNEAGHISDSNPYAKNMKRGLRAVK